MRRLRESQLKQKSWLVGFSQILLLRFSSIFFFFFATHTFLIIILKSLLQVASSAFQCLTCVKFVKFAQLYNWLDSQALSQSVSQSDKSFKGAGGWGQEALSSDSCRSAFRGLLQKQVN